MFHTIKHFILVEGREVLLEESNHGVHSIETIQCWARLRAIEFAKELKREIITRIHRRD